MGLVKWRFDILSGIIEGYFCSFYIHYIYFKHSKWSYNIFITFFYKYKKTFSTLNWCANLKHVKSTIGYTLSASFYYVCILITSFKIYIYISHGLLMLGRFLESHHLFKNIMSIFIFYFFVRTYFTPTWNKNPHCK
jgi:hypothetical protein